MNDNIVYISYGKSKYDPQKFNEIKNLPLFGKPLGGLWASPIDAPFGWKQWCEDINYVDCDLTKSFCFTLDKNANVIHLNSSEDCRRLPLVQLDPFFQSLTAYQVFPDFEKLKNNGIDAIQFNLSAEKSGNMVDGMHSVLFGWDCDSILILNKNVIVSRPSGGAQL